VTDADAERAKRLRVVEGSHSRFRLWLPDLRTGYRYPAKVADLDLPNEPKQVHLRSAISAAYYALLHLLTTEAAEKWGRQRRRHRFARLFDHGRMKTCCSGLKKRFKKRLGKNPTPDEVEIGANLMLVGEAFLRLQEERHTADYDSSVV
jgi:hypothetical protein